MTQAKFDLEDRLLDFAVRVIRVTESMKRTLAGMSVADQFWRSGSSSFGHHGEMEDAESRDDFVPKRRICYKELREARGWLCLVPHALVAAKVALLVGLVAEADELGRIFTASIRTAENKI